MAEFPVGKCKGNHGMALDPDNHRIYAPAQEENGTPAAKIAVFEVVPSS